MHGQYSRDFKSSCGISVLISNNPRTFANKGSRFVALDHRHSKGWIFLHQGIPDKMYYSEEWRRIRQKGLSSAAKKVVMCNYPRLYCTNGENVPDLLNGQQRLNRVRADSVTMVITVAFLVLAPPPFFLYRTPRSQDRTIGGIISLLLSKFSIVSIQ